MKNTAESSLVVLKLGGSVITKKKKRMTPNLAAIERLSREIADARVERLVVVHGGGSFGHPIAKEYKIMEGFHERSQLEGFSKAHQAMLKLNRLVVDSLIQHSIPAFSIVPSSCVVTKAGRIQALNDCPIAMLLDMGLVPILFGDTVFDSEKGFTILSGDQLVAAVAIKFRARKIILGVDVDGFYTANPKDDSSAELIERVTLPELKKRLNGIEETKASDVTGEMLGKIRELIPAVQEGIEAIIVNANIGGNTYRALQKQEVRGTVVGRR